MPITTKAYGEEGILTGVKLELTPEEVLVLNKSLLCFEKFYLGQEDSRVSKEIRESMRKAIENEESWAKIGHWVYDKDGIDWGIPAWRCSICGCRNDNIPTSIIDWSGRKVSAEGQIEPTRRAGARFCPECGSRMVPGRSAPREGCDTEKERRRT